MLSAIARRQLKLCECITSTPRQSDLGIIKHGCHGGLLLQSRNNFRSLSFFSLRQHQMQKNEFEKAFVRVYTLGKNKYEAGFLSAGGIVPVCAPTSVYKRDKKKGRGRFRSGGSLHMFVG